MRSTVYAVVSVLLAWTCITQAQCPAETSLFFSNGMFNSKQSANDSRRNLEMRLSETENWKRSRTYLAYNEDENAAYRLLEVYEQKSGDFGKTFWRWMWDWSAAPDWFKDSMKAAMAKQDLHGLQGYELSDHVIRYEGQMDLDRSIVVVAHSQGNFFANNASLILQNEHYPAATQFRIVAVATPASFVNDDGPYFTLKSDGVIRLIPTALPPNMVNESPKPGFFDHRFVDHYLNGQPTGQKIIDTVQATIKSLAEETKKDENYNAECWKWFKSLSISPKTDSQECTLECTIAKNDFSNFSCNQLCEAYCQCSVKRAEKH